MKNKIIDWIFLIFTILLGTLGVIKELDFICGVVIGIMLLIGVSDIYTDYKEDK